MQLQKLKMAAMCNQCGELFDMAYDMKKVNTGDDMDGMELALSWKNRGKALCWECRIDV